jgi:integrase
MTTEVCRYLKKWGFKDISLHSFRHTHGSNLLSTGVPLPTVSKRLGHSSPRITAEIYSHALPSDEIAAADAWDRLMQPKKPGKERPQ